MKLCCLAVCCVAGTMMATPASGQTFPEQQGGTYNVPAGTGASTPFRPSGSPMGSFSSPGQSVLTPSPPNILDRDVLKASTSMWLWQLRLQQRNPVPPTLPPEVPPGKAEFTVKLPKADAQLLVNDQVTKRIGQSRTFVTPALQPGTYRYRFQAAWTEGGKPVHAAQTLIFEPGDNLTVDFTATPGPNR